MHTCNTMTRMVAFSTFALGILSSSAHAETFSSTDIQLLYGRAFNKDYVTGNDTEDGHMRTITIEHFGTWEKGDNFFFLDLTNGNFKDGNNEHFYTEWHPRVSLSKLTGKKLSYGFIKDTYIAGEINLGDSPTRDPADNLMTADPRTTNFRAQQEGIGFDLVVPGFEVFGLNIYSRRDNFYNRRTYQISPFWSTHFNLGRARFEFSGFLDADGVQNGREIMTQPQLLLDVGQWAGMPKDRVLVGCEWLYHKLPNYSNSAPQAMVKWYW